jgi:CheY-like chemotaxis protein
MLTSDNYILYAENNPAERGRLHEKLAEIHCSMDLISFNNGLELVQYLGSLQETNALPKCIFLAVSMPVWDGIRTLSTLKMKEIWKSIPVVVLADPSEAKDGELSVKLGAEKCIYKPVNTTDLTFLNGTPAQAPGQQIPLQIIFK